MKRFNYWRIFAFAGAFSLLLFYSLYWLDFLDDPDQRTGSDFIGFYNFGRITQEKGIQFIYDIDEQRRIEEQVVGHPVTVIFYTHLPYIAPLAAAVVDEDYLASLKRWAVILLLLNALNVWILAGLLNRQRYTREAFLILGMGAFLFDPTFTGFINGQDSAILLLGASIWMWGLLSEKHLVAGLGLSLTTVRPQIALFLAIPFFFRHRRVFWGFVLGSSVLAGLSFWLLKLEGTLQFIESLRYIENTVWLEAHANAMPTLSGFIRRNFQEINIPLTKSLVWVAYVLGLAGFCLLWRAKPRIAETEIGWISLAALILAPYAHYHELTLLLLPIFGILRKWETLPVNMVYPAALPLAVSWLCALSFAGSGAWMFWVLNPLMLLLGYMVWKPEKFAGLLVATLPPLHEPPSD